MKKIKNIFTDHPKSIGETYFEHLQFALAFGFNMARGGLACMIHAFLPFLFQKTASSTLLKLTSHVNERTTTMQVVES